MCVRERERGRGSQGHPDHQGRAKPVVVVVVVVVEIVIVIFLVMVIVILVTGYELISICQLVVNGSRRQDRHGCVKVAIPLKQTKSGMWLGRFQTTESSFRIKVR